MKSTAMKNEFINMRAQSKSYSAISEALKISKSTCAAWERELKDQITIFKQEQLYGLYEAYYMTKEARIRKLGDTLKSIDAALDGIDLSQIPPEKLLDFKLKYTEALKEEYTGTAPAYRFGKQITPDEILLALKDLLNRSQAGEISTEQAKRESLIISNLLKAYEIEVRGNWLPLETIV